MALKPCRECGKEISDQAETCPNCGIKNPGINNTTKTALPLPAPPTKAKGGVGPGCLTAIILSILAIGGIVALASGGGEQEGSSQPAQTASSNAPLAPAPASGPAPAAPVASPTIVFVGNRGRVNGTTMACPNKDDVIAFINSYDQATLAKDEVGKQDAISTAPIAGCNTFVAGDAGLVIDSSGFLEKYDEVRMDSDATAYWMPAGDISPIPGQPDNP